MTSELSLIKSLESLIDIDHRIFFFLNQQLRNPVFDFVMPYFRDRNFWIPLYLVLVTYFVWRFRKYSWPVFLFAAITVIITDQLSSSLIKPLVHRLRPCNDPSLASQVHLLVGCGSGYSFVSSHAANHFGIAFFVIVLLQNRFPWIVPVSLLWATLVCFAQIYVGLHYPADIFCGAVLGTLTGIATGRICKYLLVKKNPASFI